METLAELLARDRRSDAIACRVGAAGRSYDYDRFLTTTWQAGNFLRYHGVRSDAVIGVADDTSPEAVLAMLGAGLLGATVWVEPPLGADLAAIVCPGREFRQQKRQGNGSLDSDIWDQRAASTRIAYGESIEDPTIEQFEAGIWSENPTMPPERPDPETVLFTDGRTRHDQRTLLDRAQDEIETQNIESGTEVVLAGSLGDPSTFISCLATLAAVGTIVLPGEDPTEGDGGVDE